MTKSDLVSAVAEKVSFTKKDTEIIINATLDAVTEALVAGDKVQLVGFGTFEVRDRAARTGVNPQTHEKITIAASRAPAFKAGKALKEAVEN